MQQSGTIEQIQQRIALHDDMQAYENLYSTFYSGLYRFSIAIVRIPAVAEEIISDVFIKVWQIRKRLMEIDNIKLYLYSLIKNFSLNFIHRQNTEIAIDIEKIAVEAQIEIGNREDLCISDETVKKVHHAIAQLTPQCQLVFQLIKEDGFSYREAAAIMNIPAFISRNYLILAIRRVAEVLPSYRQTAIPNIKSFSAS